MEWLERLQLIWACFLNVLMGGVVYGFASLIYVLEASEDEGGMSMSPQYAQLCFAVAISFSCISPILMSTFIEGFGPRVTAIACTFIFSVGSLIFGVSDIHRFGLFIPGLCLMAFAGPGIHGSSHYCVHNFPTRKGFVNTALSMSFHASFVVFYILQEIWWHRLRSGGSGDSRALFCYYAFACLLTTVPSMFIIPDSVIPNRGLSRSRGGSNSSFGSFENGVAELDDRMLQESNHSKGSSVMDPFSGGESKPLVMDIPLNDLGKGAVGASLSMGSLSSVVSGEHTEVHYDKYRSLSLSEKLASPVFRRLAIFFAIATTWVNFYIGTVDISLGDSAILPYKEQHDYAIIFSVVLAGGCFVVPLVGYCMDVDQGMMGVPFTSLILSVLSLLWACTVLIENEAVILPSFACYSFFRVFLYIFTFAYVQDVFGPAYSDVLMGVLFLVSGVANILTIPMTTYAIGDCAVVAENLLTDCDRGNWSNVFLLKIASTLYFFYFTLTEWRERRHYLFELGFIEFTGRFTGSGSKYAGRIKATKSNESMSLRSATYSTIRTPPPPASKAT